MVTQVSIITVGSSIHILEDLMDNLWVGFHISKSLLSSFDPLKEPAIAQLVERRTVVVYT